MTEEEVLLLVVAVMVRRIHIGYKTASEGACLKEAKRRFLHLKETHPEIAEEMLRDAGDILAELDKAEVLR